METEYTEYKIGDIVLSRAGRDKGEYFVVMEVSDNYLTLCNGMSRRTEKPKRKKQKHVKSGFGYSEFVREKLQKGESPTNRELKRELLKYIG